MYMGLGEHCTGSHSNGFWLIFLSNYGNVSMCKMLFIFFVPEENKITSHPFFLVSQILEIPNLYVWWKKMLLFEGSCLATLLRCFAISQLFPHTAVKRTSFHGDLHSSFSFELLLDLKENETIRVGKNNRNLWSLNCTFFFIIGWLML